MYRVLMHINKITSNYRTTTCEVNGLPIVTGAGWEHGIECEGFH